jgi:hypothetical protein
MAREHYVHERNHELLGFYMGRVFPVTVNGTIDRIATFEHMTGNYAKRDVHRRGKCTLEEYLNEHNPRVYEKSLPPEQFTRLPLDGVCLGVQRLHIAVFAGQEGVLTVADIAEHAAAAADIASHRGINVSVTFVVQRNSSAILDSVKGARSHEMVVLNAAERPLRGVSFHVTTTGTTHLRSAAIDCLCALNNSRKIPGLVYGMQSGGNLKIDLGMARRIDPFRDVCFDERTAALLVRVPFSGVGAAPDASTAASVFLTSICRYVPLRASTPLPECVAMRGATEAVAPGYSLSSLMEDLRKFSRTRIATIWSLNTVDDAQSSGHFEELFTELDMLMDGTATAMKMRDAIVHWSVKLDVFVLAANSSGWMGKSRHVARLPEVRFHAVESSMSTTDLFSRLSGSTVFRVVLSGNEWAAYVRSLNDALL